MKDFQEKVEELPEHWWGHFVNQLTCDDYGNVSNAYISYIYYVYYTDEEVNEIIEKKTKTIFMNKIQDYFGVNIFKWDCRIYKLFKDGVIDKKTMIDLMNKNC